MIKLFSDKKKKPGEEKPNRVGDQLDFVTREAYNVLRTNLTLSFTGEKKCRVIGVTSSFPHEGKSFTTINLCYALAKDNHKILLLSGDLRKPMAEVFLGLRSDKGLADVLTGDVTDPVSVIHENVLVDGFSAMTAGSLPPNPSELLGSEAMGALLDRMKGDYEYIVIDLPPVISVVDPIAVSKYLDGMIVVVMHRYARKKFIRTTMTQLRYAGVRVLGFVYNGVASGFRYYTKEKYYKKHYYGYYSSHKDNNDSTEKGKENG